MFHFTTFHNVYIYVKCQEKLVMNALTVNLVAQKSEKVTFLDINTFQKRNQ